jgi:WD40 repeat protein
MRLHVSPVVASLLAMSACAPTTSPVPAPKDRNVRPVALEGARVHDQVVLSQAQFSTDGKKILALFVVGQGGKDRFESTSLYDARTGKRLADGPRNYLGPPWCPFVPDTTLLLIGKDSDTPALGKTYEKAADDGFPLGLWDWNTGKFVREFQPRTDHVDSVAVSPNGKLALTGHWDGRILAWDLTNGKQARSFETPREPDLSDRHIPRLFFFGDSSRVVACSGDSIKVWDPASGKEIGPKFTEYAAAQNTSCHNSSVFSPDAMLLCTYFTYANPKNPLIRIWDLKSGKLKNQINFKLNEGSCIGAVAFADHGKRLLICWDDQRFRFWDVASGKPASAVSVVPDVCVSPGGVFVSPDGRFVLTAPDNRRIGLWDIAKEKLVWSASAAGSSNTPLR